MSMTIEVSFFPALIIFTAGCSSDGGTAAKDSGTSTPTSPADHQAQDAGGSDKPDGGDASASDFDPLAKVVCDGKNGGQPYISSLRQAIKKRLEEFQRCEDRNDCTTVGSRDLDLLDGCTFGECCGAMISAKHKQAFDSLQESIDNRCAEYRDICGGLTTFMACDCDNPVAVPACVDGTCQMISPDGAVP